MSRTRLSELRRGRHCVFLLHVHLIFVTKYRKKVFEEVHLKRLEEIFRKVCRNFGAELVEFNGEADHVHLLINYLPRVAVSRLVNSLKGVSSRLLRKEFSELEKHYWKGTLWSPSYFAGSCGGAPLEAIKRYIESQDGLSSSP